MRLPWSVICVRAQRASLDLTKQKKRTRRTTSKPNRKATKTHQSIKDYSLQQINNGDNRRLSISCAESVQQGRKERKNVCVGGAGGGGVWLSDEVRHLFLNASSQIEPICQTA